MREEWTTVYLDGKPVEGYEISSVGNMRKKLENDGYAYAIFKQVDSSLTAQSGEFQQVIDGRTLERVMYESFNPGAVVQSVYFKQVVEGIYPLHKDNLTEEEGLSSSVLVCDSFLNGDYYVDSPKLGLYRYSRILKYLIHFDSDEPVSDNMIETVLRIFLNKTEKEKMQAFLRSTHPLTLLRYAKSYAQKDGYVELAESLTTVNVRKEVSERADVYKPFEFVNYVLLREGQHLNYTGVDATLARPDNFIQHTHLYDGLYYNFATTGGTSDDILSDGVVSYEFDYAYWARPKHQYIRDTGFRLPVYDIDENLSDKDWLTKLHEGYGGPLICNMVSIAVYDKANDPYQIIYKGVLPDFVCRYIFGIRYLAYPDRRFIMRNVQSELLHSMDATKIREITNKVLPLLKIVYKDNEYDNVFGVLQATEEPVFTIVGELDLYDDLRHKYESLNYIE